MANNYNFDVIFNGCGSFWLSIAMSGIEQNEINNYVNIAADQIMIIFWFICPLQNNNSNYGTNNKVKK
jgi:hypothetical protein